MKSNFSNAFRFGGSNVDGMDQENEYQLMEDVYASRQQLSEEEQEERYLRSVGY